MPGADNPFQSLKLELAVSSGIPEAVAATLNYATKVRETMDPDVRRRFDLMNAWVCEQFWGMFGYKPPQG